jgi:hypothetical protein
MGHRVRLGPQQVPPHGNPAKGLLGKIVVLARLGGILGKAARIMRMARLCWRHLSFEEGGDSMLLKSISSKSSQIN